MLLSARRAVVLVIVLTASAVALAQPSARTGARMAFHEDSRRIVLFGGLTPPDVSGTRYPLADTWEWLGRRWVRLIPAASPSPRSDFILVSQASRTRLLLFGGTTGVTTEVLGDTWIFDEDTWRQLATPTSPPARRLAAAGFDPVRDRVVLFGGADATTALFDTWEFDGAAWHLISQDGPKINTPMMVWDDAQHELLMLGVNQTDVQNPVVEMYRLNDTTWEKLTPASLPRCASLGTLVYLEYAARVVYYGGLCASGFPSSESWSWDGTDWNKFTPFPSAGAVFSNASAYDRVRHELVIFGGNSGGPNGFTFVFKHDMWRFVDQGGTPGPRSLMVLKNDPVRNVIWLFGGQNESARYADLWSYAFGRWQRISAPDGPLGCDFPNGAFDTDRERLVIVCESSDTYEWDGTKWYKFPDLRTKPPARRWSSMVYDPRSRRMVLFGGWDGNYLNATWTWNGVEWREIETRTEPPRRALAMLFFDPIQQRVMIYGGIGRMSTEGAIVRFKDMWSFDGSNWTEQTLTTPAARYGAFIEIDPQTNRLVMFGGKDERERFLNEHWEWTGSAWQQVDSANRPTPRMNGGMAFDPTRGHLIQYGGYAGGYFSDVWGLVDNRWEFQHDVIPVRRRPATTDPPTESDDEPTGTEGLSVIGFRFSGETDNR